MPNRKVYIINTDVATTKMFHHQPGWEITYNPSQADMFQFTGSGNSDVSPALYKEHKHRRTYPAPDRDRMESAFYSLGRKYNIPMAGICRGAQFLNVMNGGWLWQDVNGHQKPHYVEDVQTGEVYIVSSSHHQMMRTPRDAIVLVIAGEATYRDWCTRAGVESTVMSNPKSNLDPEVVLFPKTKCLAVQYHPEYEGFSALVTRYFDHIEQHLF